jgi:hypothetical protein
MQQGESKVLLNGSKAESLTPSDAPEGKAFVLTVYQRGTTPLRVGIIAQITCFCPRQSLLTFTGISAQVMRSSQSLRKIRSQPKGE